MMNKPRLVILANEIKSDHELWVNACMKRSDDLEFRVVDLTAAGWYERITGEQTDYLLAKPGGLTSKFKKLYDERLTILVKNKNYRSFPTLDEVLIHENKIFQAYWLKANGLPHPATSIFYHKHEAEQFMRSAELPLVAKLNIGSSGKGVEVISTREELEGYVEEIFSAGKSSRSGPNLERGQWLQRAFRVFTKQGLLKERFAKYRAIREEKQTGFVLFQEYIPHEYEWRAVRIGDSFFAHKKLKTGNKASGSLKKEYGAPPVELLNFTREITERFDFHSMSLDLFDTSGNSYLINEMQCIFGQSDPYQMTVGGKPGRYIFEGGEWVFEEGDFCSNQCFDLRLDHILRRLRSE